MMYLVNRLILDINLNVKPRITKNDRLKISHGIGLVCRESNLGKLNLDVPP